MYQIVKMGKYLPFIILTVVLLLLENYHCRRMLKVIPGVPNVTYYDERYIRNIVFTTRRYGRKSDYVTNIEGETRATFGRNVTADAIFFEYLHNEYRRSFVEWHGNLCSLIANPLLGPVLHKAGLSFCPVPPGKYKLANMTFDQEFPNTFPFKKGKTEISFFLEPSKKLIVRGDLVMTFIQRTV